MRKGQKWHTLKQQRGLPAEAAAKEVALHCEGVGKREDVAGGDEGRRGLKAGDRRDLHLFRPQPMSDLTSHLHSSLAASSEVGARAAAAAAGSRGLMNAQRGSS